jgi:DNA modification methylase
MSTRSWFSVDGTLEPIPFEGPSYFRFPLEVATFAVKNFSHPGSWILDPFCGFGTTLVAAQQEGRHAVGFEKDPERGSFARQRVVGPSRVILDDARNVARYELPVFDLLFTSPPYTSLRDGSAFDAGALRRRDLDRFYGDIRASARRGICSFGLRAGRRVGAPRYVGGHRQVWADCMLVRTALGGRVDVLAHDSGVTCGDA